MSDQQILTLNLAQGRFPYMFKGETIVVDQVHVLVRWFDEFKDSDEFKDLESSDTELEFTLIHPGGEDTIGLGPYVVSLGDLRHKSINNINSRPGDWSLTVTNVGEGLSDETSRLNPNAIGDIVFVLHFTVTEQ